jgi:phage shock protein PspC (stress-responsive transcriptional regulator)
MSLIDELERLATLRDRGVLDDEEFLLAKSRLLRDEGDRVQAPVDPVAAVSRLRRSPSDRWLGGVCGGLARITGMESWIWRLIFAALFFFWGTGLVLYILLWIFVPNE